MKPSQIDAKYIYILFFLTLYVKIDIGNIKSSQRTIKTTFCRRNYKRSEFEVTKPVATFPYHFANL